MRDESAGDKLKETYDLWIARRTTKEDLYIAIKAFVENYTSRLNGKVERHHDDIVSIVAFKLYTRLAAKEFRTDGFIPVLYRIMTKEVSQTANIEARGHAPEGYIPIYGRMPTARDAEVKMFLDELDDDMYSWVFERIRFKGSMRDAALYVLDMETKRKYPSPVVLRGTYGVQNPTFVRDYVTVMCRRFLHECVKEHGNFIFHSRAAYIVDAEPTPYEDAE